MVIVEAVVQGRGKCLVLTSEIDFLHLVIFKQGQHLTVAYAYGCKDHITKLRRKKGMITDRLID